MQRRVQITGNAAQVVPASEQWSDAPWAVSQTTGPPHTAHVQPTSPTATPFEAVLSIPSESSFSPTRATVTVTDQRQTWFQSHITNSVVYVQGSQSTYFTPGSTTPITYVSGQVSIAPWTKLSGNNPGLAVHASATITRNGTAVPGLPSGRVAFPLHDDNLRVGTVTLIESTPPPTTPDRVVVTTQYFVGPSAPTPFHTATETVLVAASPAVGPGADATTLTNDNAWITSTLIPHSPTTSSAPSTAARSATAPLPPAPSTSRGHASHNSWT